MQLLSLVVSLLFASSSALVVPAAPRARAPVMCTASAAAVSAVPHYTGVALTKNISFAIDLDGAHVPCQHASKAT